MRDNIDGLPTAKLLELLLKSKQKKLEKSDCKGEDMPPLPDLTMASE